MGMMGWGLVETGKSQIKMFRIQAEKKRWQLQEACTVPILPTTLVMHGERRYLPTL